MFPPPNTSSASTTPPRCPAPGPRTRGRSPSRRWRHSRGGGVQGIGGGRVGGSRTSTPQQGSAADLLGHECIYSPQLLDTVHPYIPRQSPSSYPAPTASSFHSQRRTIRGAWECLCSINISFMPKQPNLHAVLTAAHDTPSSREGREPRFSLRYLPVRSECSSCISLFARARIALIQPITNQLRRHRYV